MLAGEVEAGRKSAEERVRLETPPNHQKVFKASLWFVLRAIFIYERGNVRLNNVIR